MRVAGLWIIPTLGVLALLALAPSAHAESAAWTICAGQAISPEQRVTSCTEVIEDLSEIKERRAVAYSNRGNVFTDQRDLDRAFADLDNAIRLAPGYAPAYNNRGRVHGFREDFSRAIADYDEAIRLDPQFALAYSNRGYVWFQKIEYDRAMADFNKAIALDPELAIAYGNRAFLFQRRRDTAHAIEDFTTQIQLRPGVLSYINRGNVYREINQLDLAAADYGEVIRLAPTDARGWRNRGMIRLFTGDNKGGLADYDMALRYDPANVISWYNRGQAKMRLGDKSGAIADYRKALTLQPDLRLALDGLQRLGVKP